MGRCRKKDILDIVATMTEANEFIFGSSHINLQGQTEMFVQCQNAAMQIGSNLEMMGDQYTSIIRLLEDYCENIYQMSINLSDENRCRRLSRKIRKQLADLRNRIRYEIPEDRREVVFLPYKASMWDSLESVWKAADADENTDAYVIPIPYFDKNPDGSFGQEHYEGELYPEYVPVTRYEDYDFENRQPDMIFIHNPYDECNYVTSVHPFFYSKNLKKFTERLVYIPYFVLAEIRPDDRDAVEEMKHFCTVPGVFYADKVIVQSEDMRQIYIKVLIEEMIKEQGSGKEKEIRKYWENKIDGIGSPKFDKVLDTEKEEVPVPEEWLKVIEKKDGNRKKIIFYNTSVTALLRHGEKMLDKIEDVFRVFRENQGDVVLLWRPHPLFRTTIASMRPELEERYQRIVEEYRKEGWGIYDDTADVERAIAVSDGYYGDQSSVVQMYKQTGKPIMMQNVDIISREMLR